MDSIRRFFLSETTLAVILISLLAAVIHVPLMTQFGYYRDDWYFLWAGYTQGTQTIRELFLLDRPLMGVKYAIDYTIFGTNPLAWQMYALFLSLVGAFVVFWMLRMLWHEKRFATTAATILFVVYPGFLQQPNAATFHNQLFGYSVGLISIALTVRAVMTNRKWETVVLGGLSVISALVYFFIYEYMIGLEGLRAVLLWVALRKKGDQPFRDSLLSFGKWLMITAIPMVGFLYWRLFIFESTRNATDVTLLLGDYRSAPYQMLARLMVETGKDFIETVFLAWGHPIYEALAGASYGDLRNAALLVFIAVGSIVGYYLFLKRSDLMNSEEGQFWNLEFFWIGVFTVVATLIPMVAAGRNVHFSSGFDRYTLQTTVGVSLLIIGGIFYAMRTRLRLFMILGLVGIAVTTHHLNGIYFRDLWNYQQDLWWQLSWRAPDLENNTVLVAVLPSGYRLAEGYEIWGPANIIYAPEADAPVVFGQVLGVNTAEKIILGERDSRKERKVVPIFRNYKRTLLLSLPTTTSCLHAIDGRKIELDQDENVLVRWVAPHSEIEQIIPNGSPHLPPSSIFGAEPEHTWCYYYQKADLARQTGDWEEIVRLGDEAFQKGLEPYDSSELIPFLEGYASAGKLDQAGELAGQVIQYEFLRQGLCSQLQTPPEYPESYAYQTIFEMICQSQ